MRGLRTRMAATAIAASGAALLAVLFLVGPSLRRRALETERELLLAEARLMARVVAEPLARGDGPAELDPLVDSAAREVRARVTIIAPDGRVLADSAVSGAELLALESHAGRPEVKEALAAGSGTSFRHSTTVGQDLLYAAVSIRQRERLVGVARVALSAADVEAQARELRDAVGVALALAFLITGLLSALLSAPLAGPLRDLMAAAREFASGNLKARMRARRSDELGELARILNQAAQQLDERLAENARERARTEAILAAMEDAVLAVDQRGSVLLANDAFRRGFGVGDVLGRHYVEAIRERGVDEVVQAVLAYGQRRSLEMEVPRLRRTFAVTGVPLPGESGAPQGAVVTLHDVTERRRAERVRRDFVANASHELRTPLTSIRGFVEALEDGAIEEHERGRRFLGKIRTHADRMAALVEDLLELSRLEAGERPAAYQETAPDDVVEDVLASFAGLAERKGIALVQRNDDAPRVVTDTERLRRILENLVDNAIKYTSEGGRVEVRTAARPEGGAVVEVADNGPGIGTEHLPRIFERFYRVDKARSRELGGTGLGLAIVKHLAEGMGAKVTVASELGHGSRFSVALPAGHDRTQA